MLKSFLRYCAKKSHDVKIQLLLATLYGLVDLFGITGAVAIIMKARKLSTKKPGNRVTAQPGKVTK